MRKLVSDGVFEIAERSPQSVAIQFSNIVITYGELVSHIRAIAVGVAALENRRVAVSLSNHPSILEIFFGVICVGGEFLLFESRWSAEITQKMLVAHSPQLFFADVNEYLDWRKAQSTNRKLISQATADMPFLIGFTSGTTGIPKAFTRSHISWIRSFDASRTEFGINSQTRILIPGPLSHGLSFYAAVETLNAGGAVFIEPYFDAVSLARLIYIGRINTIAAAPTLYDLILEAMPNVSLFMVNTIISAGAKLPPSLRVRLRRVFPNAEVIEYYGASELSFVTVSKTDDRVPVDSVGRAFTGVSLQILDNDGAPLDAGEVGLVWVKSDMVCSGYVGDTDGSGFRLENGWATVGDYGILDRQGFLTLVGRDKDMIITGGLNVYPSEVELVIGAAQGVKEVVVFGDSDERWGQIITAVVSGDGLNLKSLKRYCMEHLVSYKRPRRWFCIQNFQYTPSGKIDRTAILKLMKTNSLKALS